MRSEWPDERRRALALLERHGWNATSFQILEPQFRYWFPDDDAVVAYVQTGRARVVAGGPICETERLDGITRRFIEESERDGYRVRFFPVESRLLERVGGLRSINVGAQPWWNPLEWDAMLRSRRSLREQLRRARASGVVAETVAGEDLVPGSPARLEIERVISVWLNTRAMAPMAFLVDVEPFEFAGCRRYFVARHGSKLVAVAAVVPVYARNGWFLEDLIRDPDAPNGSVELLVDAVVRDIARSNATYFTLGVAPLAGVEGSLASIRSVTRSLYNFDGVLRFKRKFSPTGEDRVNLAFPEGDNPALATLDLLRAFARHGFAAFAADTVFRAPPLVLAGLAGLLVVWTGVLSLPVAAPYFPSNAIRYGWIAFDLVIAGLLFAVAQRWRRRIAATLASLIALDVILSFVQFWTYNARMSWSGWQWGATAVALSAPVFALGIVVGGIRRHRKLRDRQPRRR